MKTYYAAPITRRVHTFEDPKTGQRRKLVYRWAVYGADDLGLSSLVFRTETRSLANQIVDALAMEEAAA